jgi:hypothetical protein
MAQIRDAWIPRVALRRPRGNIPQEHGDSSFVQGNEVPALKRGRRREAHLRASGMIIRVNDEIFALSGERRGILEITGAILRFLTETNNSRKTEKHAEKARNKNLRMLG